MRVLVCGGRDFANQKLIDDVMYHFDMRYDITVLITGHCRGADRMAEEWCKVCGKNRIAIEPYPADWQKHGRKAGFLRNQQMLDEGKPELVVAFPGGNGTHDMCRRAKKAGVSVITVVDN